ncbi:MAG: FtsK/SpoIIIE domain-containing protein [Eubacteriales bacterium]|nr:FtsK/SpoIIIE domain-containing protein [Eubacteriales bacterium]
MQKYSFHKVRPYSYCWLKWVYFLYIALFCLAIISYMITRKGAALFGTVAMILIGVIFIATIQHTKLYKARKITRLIQKHIKENGLCQTEIRGRREIYSFYPATEWRIDESVNTLYIRFRLTGNKINLRGLETGLADRLEKVCLNVYERRGYIEYLFGLHQEEQLVISSQEDIHGESGQTEITLSPSGIWDYRKIPHFLVVGGTGTGKTTFVRFIISTLLKCDVRVLYLDVKRDAEMERFCHGNVAITYAYEPQQIAEEIANITDEMQTRTADVAEMENRGIDKNYQFNFNPVYVICDEIILMKLVFPDKLYKETIAQINAIIVSGRSKNIFAGLISQSGLAEYFGNSGIRGNIGLKVALGQMSASEYSMIFGNEFSDIKNLRYGEIGSGLIMRNGIDSRPREFVAPYIKKGVLD